MKRLWMALILVSLLWVPSQATSADLHFLHAPGGAPLPCNATWMESTYPGNPMVPWYLKATTLNVWLSGGARGYVALELIQRTPNQDVVLQRIWWNHYADAGLPSNFRQSFGPDWVILAPNEPVILRTYCDAQVSGQPATVVPQATLEFSLTP